MTGTSKLHKATAITTGLFIIVMFLVFFHPVHIKGTEKSGDLETLFGLNQGLIWLVGISLGVGLFVLTYINGIFQRDLTDCTKTNLEKNKIIEAQNEKIISNQLEYITQIKKLGEDLNTNFEKDNESRASMIKVMEDVSKFGARLALTEKAVKRWDNLHKELGALTVLVKMHDKDIDTLKKKAS